MAADRIQQILRRIPQVDQVLSVEAVSEAARQEGHEIVLRYVREELEQIRSRIRGGGDPSGESLEPAAIGRAVLRRLARAERSGVHRVINATGIVLHTGLGRAVLPPAVLDAVCEHLRGYSTLEVDAFTGERSIREARVAELLCAITGAEAATVVNNNAGATLLALSAMAAGREVILSRSQMIEIGGSFRMPDVMRQSGCRLVEVGTTNKTYPRDVEGAITPDTALLLHVHTSNYRIAGFSRQVEIEEMVQLGRKHGVPVMDDVGSGLLVDLSNRGVNDEPTVQRSVKAGADVICFSGDKMLGGPQAGLIVGAGEAVKRVRAHPLFRALRPGKFTLLALQACLKPYLSPERLPEQNPTLRMLTADRDGLEAAALKLAERLNRVKGLKVTVEDEVSEAGGGSMPAHPLPTKVVAVEHPEKTAAEIAQALRDGDPGVMTRVQKDRVLFDVRTLLEGEEEEIAGSMRRIFGASK